MSAVITPPREAGMKSDRVAASYRPHLDGLRAMAVYLVVLFHAGSDRFSGGFVGVDVFFVLSGYLVTQLLLRDLADPGLDPLPPLLRPPVPAAAAGGVRRPSS